MIMEESLFDPYDILRSPGLKSPNSEGLLFANTAMLPNFNDDISSISPVAALITSPVIENEFDPTIFEKLLNELCSTDPTTLTEESIDISMSTHDFQTNTREIGTDPMEQAAPTLPLIIRTANTNDFGSSPIFLIQTINQVPINNDSLTFQTIPTEFFNLQPESSVTIGNDYQMEDVLPLTPSSSSESHDEQISNSPESNHENSFSKLLTDLDNLPATGKLVLTNEEIKLIKQEGYEVPSKLPLNKTEERLLKKIRRKIKNKISAQESRRKKKEYVDTLEKEIAKYIEENNSLKERMTMIEKNQKTLQKERDLLRSMLNKNTPTPSTAVMVFAIFFAVLFGVWSPITNKKAFDDRSLSIENAVIPSNNHQSIYEQKDSTHNNYVTDSYKSRVLLSMDEYDSHHHGPYLPSNNKYKSALKQQTAAPGYTYSNSVEQYMNKKVRSENNLKRTKSDDFLWDMDQEITYKKIRSNYQSNDKIVVVDEIINDLNQSKPVKIIRVERTTPAIVNETLKLARRTANE